LLGEKRVHNYPSLTENTEKRRARARAVLKRRREQIAVGRERADEDCYFATGETSFKNFSRTFLKRKKQKKILIRASKKK